MFMILPTPETCTVYNYGSIDDCVLQALSSIAKSSLYKHTGLGSLQPVCSVRPDPEHPVALLSCPTRYSLLCPVCPGTVSVHPTSSPLAMPSAVRLFAVRLSAVRLSAVRLSGVRCRPALVALLLTLQVGSLCGAVQTNSSSLSEVLTRPADILGHAVQSAFLTLSSELDNRLDTVQTELDTVQTGLDTVRAQLDSRLGQLSSWVDAVQSAAGSCSRHQLPRDCSDLPAGAESGVHLLQPGLDPSQPPGWPPTATWKPTVAAGRCSSGGPTSPPGRTSSSAGRPTRRASASWTPSSGGDWSTSGS